MDTTQWPQEIVVRPIEEMVVRNTCPRPPPSSSVDDHNHEQGKPRQQALINCPRCHSTNTKFCYYNNYSLTQPRYFCKTCRRYWTHGGSLRNIPVGGSSRKNNKRSSSSSSYNNTNYSSTIKLSNIIHDNKDNDNNNPSKVVVHQVQDLNLSFSNISPSSSSASSSSSSSSTITTSHHIHNLSALELINGITTSRSLNNTTATFMPIPPPSSSVIPTNDDDPNIGYTSFPLLLHHHHHHDFKASSLNLFSLDEIGSSGGRILFPFEDLKHGSSSTIITTMDQDNSNKEQHQGDSTGYWTSMLGGGSW